MKLRAYLLMLFVVAVWGSTFVLIKGALNHATPAAFNLARMTLAFAVMAIGYHRYWRGIRRWQVLSGALVGLCLATGYQFQTLGLVRTTPSKSAFITGLMVVLVPLFSAIPGLRPPGAPCSALECLRGRGAGLRRHHSADDSGRIGGTVARRSPACFPDLSSINLGDVLTLRLRGRVSRFTASRLATSRRASAFRPWRCCRWASARCSWP